MKHHVEVRYDASAEQVLRMFADPKFHTAKLEAMGMAGSRVLDNEDRGETFMIRIERKVPLAVPGMKKGAGSSCVNHTERWNRKQGSGEISAVVPGMPLDMTCIASIRDDGDGCVASYDWNVHSKVPVVGKAIEKFVVGDLDKRFNEEVETTKKMLADYR